MFIIEDIGRYQLSGPLEDKERIIKVMILCGMYFKKWCIHSGR